MKKYGSFANSKVLLQRKIPQMAQNLQDRFLKMVSIALSNFK